jgi:hypothetical protein
MGLGNNVESLLNNAWRNDTGRQIVLPVAQSPQLTANAAGLTYGNWADIALLATIVVDTLVVGVVVHTPSAIDEYTVDIGSTLVGGVIYANAAAVNGAGGAVIAAAHRQEVRVLGGVYTFGGAAAGSTAVDVVQGYVPLRTPVYIPGGVGIIGRCYGFTAAAVTCRVSVVCLQGFS